MSAMLLTEVPNSSKNKKDAAHKNNQDAESEEHSYKRMNRLPMKEPARHGSL